MVVGAETVGATGIVLEELDEDDATDVDYCWMKVGTKYDCLEVVGT
jgi:hypothetical protein